MSASDTDALSVEEERMFFRILDTMDECSERVGALHMLGFEAKWEWGTLDEFPLIHIGRRADW